MGRSALPHLLLAVVAVAAGCLGFGPTSAATTSTGPGDASAVTDGRAAASTVQVVRVVDGDTVDVDFANGTRDTVRLLGVDTPETRGETAPAEFGAPDTAAARACVRRVGERATAFAERLLAGERVRLVRDPLSDRRGYYGRLLGYLVVDGEQFNRRLLVEGYARLYDGRFVERDRYARAERRARRAERGVWGCDG